MSAKTGAAPAVRVLVCGLALAWGCSGGGGKPELEVQTHQDMLRVRVDAKGAVLELEDSVRISIPPDALEEPVDMRVSLLSEAEIATPEPGLMRLPHAAVVVEPHDLDLRRSATVELVVDDDVPDGELRVLRLDTPEDRDFDRLELAVRQPGEAPVQGDYRLRREGEDTISSKRRAEVRVDRFSVFLTARQLAGDTTSDAGPVEPQLDAGADASTGGQMDAGSDAGAGNQADGGGDDASSGDGGASVVPEPKAHYRIIAAGGDSSVVILDGSLWAFGRSDQGRLGTGSPTVFVPTPLASVASETFVHVAGGADFFVALTEGGDLFAWGSDSAGQQGNGIELGEQALPQRVMSDVIAADVAERHVLALDGQGRLWTWGGNVQAPVETAAPSGVTFDAVAEGISHHLLLASDGSVWGWGNNSASQLGNAGGPSSFAAPQPLTLSDNTTPFANIVAIEAGDQTSYLVDHQGQLWAFGENTYGSLGAGNTAQSQGPALVTTLGTPSAFTRVAATGYSVVALDDSGQGWAFGRNQGTRILAIAPVDCNGNCNATATAFEGSSLDLIEVALGTNHGLALDRSGAMWAWGQNYYGQQGDGTALGRSDVRPTPGAVVLPDGRVPVSLHITHSSDSPRTSAVFDSGDVWTWGRSPAASGASKEGVTPARIAGLKGRDIVDHCGSGAFSLAVDDTGTVWSFGSGCNQGELGTGDPDLTTTTEWQKVALPPGTLATQVACSFNTGYALDNSGQLWAWGDDFRGQLGDGTLASPNFTATPGEVVGVDGMGLLNNVVAVDASVYSPSNEWATALLADGTMVVWGQLYASRFGRSGSVGCGSIYACSPFPVRVCDAGVIDLSDCDDDGGSGPQYLSEIDELVAAGAALFARDGDVLYSFGDNYQGLLGQGTEDGQNGYPTLMSAPVPALGGTVQQIVAGNHFGMLLDSAGDVWSWGRNNKGQLGKGSNDDASCSGSDSSCSKVPTKIPVLDAVQVVYIEAGYEHAAALDAEGRVWTWGSNGSGELGHNEVVGVGGGHQGSLEPVPVAILPR